LGRLAGSVTAGRFLADTESVFLLPPLFGIFRGKRYTYKWLSLFIQFYLLEGADLRATSDAGMSQWLAMAETLLAAIIFVTTILYIRATRAPHTEKSAQPS
jgi:uncharacterized membrane protein